MNPNQNTEQTRETLDQVKARAEQLLREQNRPTTSGPRRPAEAANPLIEALTGALERQGEGISSSASTNLQAAMASAIGQTQRAGESTRMALESERNREVAFAEDRAGATITGALEQRTGFGTQVVALRELTETTEKSVRDLRQRYNELILQNDAATAQRVSDLEVKKLEFLQEQEQQFFSNMISAAGLVEQSLGRQQSADQFWAGLGQQESQFTRGEAGQLQRLERQIFAQERQQMLGLAAEFGVPVNEGDNIESIIRKVSPFVDERRKLELEEMRASISNQRAQAAKALQGDLSNELSPIEIEALALAWNRGDTSVLKLLDSPQQLSAIQARAQAMEQERQQNLQTLAKGARNAEEFTRLVASGSVDATQEEVDGLASVYENYWRENAAAPRGGRPNRGMTEEEFIRFEQLRGTTISRP
jgi:hypothetical protein